MNLKLTLAAAAATLLFAGCTASNNGYMSMDSKDDAKPAFLMDNKGMALYTFDKDMKNKSNCYNGCEVKWPVFAGDITNLKLPAHIKAEDFGMIKRDNGAMQTTYKSKPLYYFFKDTKANDINGDGKKGVWHLVKPSM